MFVNLFDKEAIVNLVGKIDKKIFLPIRNVKGAIVGYYKKDYGYYIKEVKEKESYIQDCKQKGIKPDYARLVDTEPLVIGTPHEPTGLLDVALFLIPEMPAEVAIGGLRQ